MALRDYKGPPIKSIKSLSITESEVLYLSNRIPVHYIIGPGAPTTKIDVVFRGGRCIETKKLSGRFLSAIIRKGTKAYTSKEIEEQIDFCGGSFKSASNFDQNFLSFSCLNKHLDTILAIIESILAEPTFPDFEIEKYRKKSKENLKLDLSKSELVCYREFTSALFGNDHPYGYNTTLNLLDSIKRDDILDHYKTVFSSSNCFIIVSGNPPKDIYDLLDRRIKVNNHANLQSPYKNPQLEYSGQVYNHSSNNNYQNAIKYGRRIINRKHEDYPILFLANTILGGYFGSRLMTSIREDKGLTYNIYSTVDPLRHDGYFYIATEVAKNKTQQTLEAINEELRLLKQFEIDKEELEMVKNYLSGNFLSFLDGPFQRASLIRTLANDNLDIHYFENFFESIQKANPQQIMEIANRYFNENEFVTIVVE